MFASKMITARQMRPVKAKYSSVMKDLRQKGGSSIFPRKKMVKALWRDMRADSKSRKFGDRGFYKKDVEKFLAKKLNDKKDSFTDRRVKKMIGVFGVNRRKVLNYAAEMRSENRKLAFEQKQSQAQQQRLQDSKIRDHIRSIIDKRNTNAKNLFGSLANTERNTNKQKIASQIPEERPQKYISFGMSDGNIRKAQNILSRTEHSQNMPHLQPTLDSSGATGYVANHLRQFGKHENISEVKSMLAKIEDKGEGKDEDDDHESEV